MKIKKKKKQSPADENDTAKHIKEPTMKDGAKIETKGNSRNKLGSGKHDE